MIQAPKIYDKFVIYIFYCNRICLLLNTKIYLKFYQMSYDFYMNIYQLYINQSNKNFKAYFDIEELFKFAPYCKKSKCLVRIK